jgi:hypothetical protein
MPCDGKDKYIKENLAPETYEIIITFNNHGNNKFEIYNISIGGASSKSMGLSTECSLCPMVSP